VLTAPYFARILRPRLAIPAGVQAQVNETLSVDVVADCNRFISEGKPSPTPDGELPFLGDYFIQAICIIV
jgi:hypothetical protein